MEGKKKESGERERYTQQSYSLEEESFTRREMRWLMGSCLLMNTCARRGPESWWASSGS